MERGMSLETARRVLRIEMEAIADTMARLDASFERALDILFGCKGRVVVTGMGKSGLIGRKIAATLSSTGTPSVFLHPAEALHGDLGMMLAGDAVLAISYGGETEEILSLLTTIKRLWLPLVILTGNPRSSLAAASDVVLDTSVREEACSLNLAPTASTAAAMAMGDALAIALLERRGFSHEDFAALHPGGRLGRKMLRARDLMHTGEALPSVGLDAKMPDVIYEISKKALGMTTVTAPDGSLAGIITDGDLRRLMLKRKGEVFALTARECLTRNPVTIEADSLVSNAVRLMEQRKITCVVVTDGGPRVAGVLHVHDLWTLELGEGESGGKPTAEEEK
jgi:arabinose-5-phosphate isomerase